CNPKSPLPAWLSPTASPACPRHSTRLRKWWTGGHRVQRTSHCSWVFLSSAVVTDCTATAAYSKGAPFYNAWPDLRHRRGLRNLRVPLDKSEGVVKGIVFLCGAKHRGGLPERLKDQDSGISP